MSASRRPVVVVLSDGTRHKGVADAFDGAKAFLRLREVDIGGQLLEIHEIDMHEVLAVFFVRDLAVHRTHRLLNPTPAPQPGTDGARIRVQFVWGEILEGVVRDKFQGRGFYLIPQGASARAKNIVEAYISRSAVAKLESLDGGAALPHWDRRKIPDRRRKS
ncbi:MAG TPA: hypothetical protein VM737_04000 [Gemmatimonadota bacterium]|nr:hypothetical protein [Gemmatimonadota bacterium]